jgi:hypothetical protein
MRCTAGTSILNIHIKADEILLLQLFGLLLLEEKG